MFGIGMQEILVILVIVLILFGGKKIPELMRGMGKGLHEFKKGLNEGTGSADNKEKTEEKADNNPAKKDDQPK